LGGGEGGAIVEGGLYYNWRNQQLGWSSAIYYGPATLESRRYYDFREDQFGASTGISSPYGNFYANTDGQRSLNVFGQDIRIKAAKAGQAVESPTAWDWYFNESVVPGPRGQPLSEWRNGRPTAWGNPLQYTEAAGGAWKWGERIAVGTTVAATGLASAMLVNEALAAGGAFYISRHVLEQVSVGGGRYWSESLVRTAIRYGPRLANYAGRTPFWNYLTTFTYGVGRGEVVLNWIKRTIVHYQPK